MENVIDDRAVKRNVVILVAAQAILGAQLPLVFTVAGLSGQSLAPNPCWATLPISAVVLGSMICATPMSAIMQKYGRRAGFFLGALGGSVGGGLGALGLYQESFGLFLLGALFTGVYMSAHGFYRFAATDGAADNYRAKAVSYVLAGGLIAAIIGPQVTKFSADAFVVPFMGSYLMVIVINLAGFVLFPLLTQEPPIAPSATSPKGRSRWERVKTPAVAVAMITGMVSYALMNLVITSTPLAVVGCGFAKSSAADIVSAHVLAMYIPSFFTGHLILRYGAERIIAIGLLTLAVSGLVALWGVELTNFFVALILLGIGWNFGFIGATTLLAAQHRPEERGVVQGMNDLFVFGGVTFASLSSGGLMNCSGSSAMAGWSAVNLAMIPFLALAASALLWLARRKILHPKLG